MKHLLIILIIFSTITSFSQDQRHYSCYHITDTIRVDGLLDEEVWQKADWSEDFIDITGNPKLKPGMKTRLKMLWDKKYIYIGAEIMEKDIWATITKRDEVIFQDNDFEVFMDVEGNGLNYYEIEINAYGTVWDLLLTKAYSKMGKAVNSWDLTGLKTAVHVSGSINDPTGADSAWYVEMAFPISELMKDKNPEKYPAEGVQWRINFSRVEWLTEKSGGRYVKRKDLATGKPLPEQNWVWSPMGEINMHIPERWGWLDFTEEDAEPGPMNFLNETQKKNFRILAWTGDHPDRNRKEWEAEFARMQSNGISGILINADAATIERIIPIGEENGIEVQKWFITMMNNDKDLLKQHPEWFMVSREGKSCITEPAYVGYYRFLCPSRPEVIDYLKQRLDEYLYIQGLSAIHLDYIRFPDVILPEGLWSHYGIVQDKEYAPYDYCYCGVCRESFVAQHGFDPLLEEYPDTSVAWRQFRYDAISNVVDELGDYCNGSGKKVTAAVFPGPAVAKQIVRQEWDRWPLDEVMPMLYQDFYNGNLEWIREKTEEGVKAAGKRPYYSGLYVPSLTPRELRSAVDRAIRGGANGICLFTWDAMTSDHWKALE